MSRTARQLVSLMPDFLTASAPCNTAAWGNTPIACVTHSCQASKLTASASRAMVPAASRTATFSAFSAPSCSTCSAQHTARGRRQQLNRWQHVIQQRLDKPWHQQSVPARCMAAQAAPRSWGTHQHMGILPRGAQPCRHALQHTATRFMASQAAHQQRQGRLRQRNRTIAVYMVRRFTHALQQRCDCTRCGGVRCCTGCQLGHDARC